MDWLHLFILAVVQGLTEFLPISSSAHLILPAKIMGWPDQGPLIDLMAHLGSLGAVMLYFRRDVVAMGHGGYDLISRDPKRMFSKNAKLALYILIATPAALLVGLIMSLNGWDEAVRSPTIIALAMIIFGIVLWWADLTGKQNRTMDDMNIRSAFLIGLAQVIAFIPGTSRSGITMTAARALGFNRKESARFSMLMAIPVIIAGGSFAFLKLLSGSETTASISDGLWVAGLSFISAFFAIAVFMKLIERISFFPFMLYRIVVGFGLLWWVAANPV